VNSNDVATLFQATPFWAFVVLAVVCAVSSFVLRHFLRARQFRRMSLAGLQLYKSYINMYITRAWEQTAWLFSKFLTVLAVVLALAAAAKFMD